MGTHFSAHLFAHGSAAKEHPSLLQSLRLKKASLLTCCLLVFAAAMVMQVASQAPGANLHLQPELRSENLQQYPVAMRTQGTLDDLQGKLNLAPSQKIPWKAWSQGVLADAQAQSAHRKDSIDRVRTRPEPVAALSTPEKMSRGIERLRMENSSMQERLIQMEAAQVRALAFYEILDIDQKTIFDLFCHEFYRGLSGHDQGEGVHVRRIQAPLT